MTTCYQRKADVLAEESAGAKVIFDPEHGNFFGALGAGSHIWDQLAQPVTLEHLAHSVRESFDVPPDAPVEADIRKFIDQMVERKIVLILD